jgi:hypothetical protein
MREKPVLVRSYQRAPSVQRDAVDHCELPKNVHHIEHRRTLSVPSVREQCALDRENAHSTSKNTGSLYAC